MYCRCHLGSRVSLAPDSSQPLFFRLKGEHYGQNIDQSLVRGRTLIWSHVFRSWGSGCGSPEYAGRSDPQDDRTRESQTHSPGI